MPCRNDHTTSTIRLAFNEPCTSASSRTRNAIPRPRFVATDAGADDRGGVRLGRMRNEEQATAPPNRTPPEVDEVARSHPSEGVGLAQQLEAARHGDRPAREAILTSLLPVVAEACLRFSPSPRDYRYDELFSAGLVAANAAVDAYDPHRGVSFATFARMIIRRRLVDQYRHQVRSPEQPVTLEDLAPLANVPSAEFEALTADREELMHEMRRYATLLAASGLRLEDLAGQRRPRSAGLRHRLRAAGRGLGRAPEFAAFLQADKPLPVRPLARRYGLSPHSIRRWESFLKAFGIAYAEDLPRIQRYLDELIRVPPSRSPRPTRRSRPK